MMRSEVCQSVRYYRGHETIFFHIVFCKDHNGLGLFTVGFSSPGKVEFIFKTQSFRNFVGVLHNSFWT